MCFSVFFVFIPPPHIMARYMYMYYLIPDVKHVCPSIPDGFQIITQEPSNEFFLKLYTVVRYNVPYFTAKA